MRQKQRDENRKGSNSKVRVRPMACNETAPLLTWFIRCVFTNRINAAGTVRNAIAIVRLSVVDLELLNFCM